MTNDVTRRQLDGSAGSVPAGYSCRLLNPSPSSSRLASEEFVGFNPCAISHASGIPSPSVSVPKNVTESKMASADWPFDGGLPFTSQRLRRIFSSQLGGIAAAFVNV